MSLMSDRDGAGGLTVYPLLARFLLGYALTGKEQAFEDHSGQPRNGGASIVLFSPALLPSPELIPRLL